jgi:lipopolysaccharide cholinephosphotransferase
MIFDSDQNRRICFQILIDLEDVFKKLEIEFIIDFGTLLGACRSKRFIPWDDDVDISVAPRSLELFRHAGGSLLPRHLKILPNPSLTGPIKVADTRFTIEERSPLTAEGIIVGHPSLDIFALGAYRKFSRILPARTFGRVASLHSSASARSSVYRSSHPLKAWALRCIAATPHDVLEIVGSLVADECGNNWKMAKSNSVFGHSLGSGFGPEYVCYDSIFPLREIELEGRKFSGPNDPDVYLTSLYGHWRRIPHSDQRIPKHFLTGRSV